MKKCNMCDVVKEDDAFPIFKGKYRDSCIKCIDLYLCLHRNTVPFQFMRYKRSKIELDKVARMIDNSAILEFFPIDGETLIKITLDDIDGYIPEIDGIWISEEEYIEAGKFDFKVSFKIDGRIKHDQFIYADCEGEAIDIALDILTELFDLDRIELTEVLEL